MFWVLCYTVIHNWNDIEKTKAFLTWGSIYRLTLETKAICVKCNNGWWMAYRHLVKAKRQNWQEIFCSGRQWAHLVICTQVESGDRIFRGELGKREDEVGGEIVSYNFRHFQSPSPPAHRLPHSLPGPPVSTPGLGSARFPPTCASLNSGSPLLWAAPCSTDACAAVRPYHLFFVTGFSQT